MKYDPFNTEMWLPGDQMDAYIQILLEGLHSNRRLSTDSRSVTRQYNNDLSFRRSQETLSYLLLVWSIIGTLKYIRYYGLRSFYERCLIHVVRVKLQRIRYLCGESYYRVIRIKNNLRNYGRLR